MRNRYNTFIARHDIAWELGMAALAVVFVAVGFWSDEAPADEQGLLVAIETVLTVIFVAEFVTRLAAAYDRRAYLRGHWIDVVALVPAVRGARLLRLLRLLRLVRAFAGVYRALTHMRRLAVHRGLVWLLLAWLAVAVIASIGLFVAEQGINPSIKNPADALWWGIVTLTSVGYGDIVPVTAEGRLFGAVLMILGITLFAGITGTITSFFVASDIAEEVQEGFEEQRDRRGTTKRPDPAARLTRLHELRERELITQAEFDAKRTEIVEAR
jgi:voltage-gated potassium channel